MRESVEKAREAVALDVKDGTSWSKKTHIFISFPHVLIQLVHDTAHSENKGTFLYFVNLQD